MSGRVSSACTCPLTRLHSRRLAPPLVRSPQQREPPAGRRTATGSRRLRGRGWPPTERSRWVPPLTPTLLTDMNCVMHGLGTVTGTHRSSAQVSSCCHAMSGSERPRRKHQRELRFEPFSGTHTQSACRGACMRGPRPLSFAEMCAAGGGQQPGHTVAVVPAAAASAAAGRGRRPRGTRRGGAAAVLGPPEHRLWADSSRIGYLFTWFVARLCKHMLLRVRRSSVRDQSAVPILYAATS